MDYTGKVGVDPRSASSGIGAGLAAAKLAEAPGAHLAPVLAGTEAFGWRRSRRIAGKHLLLPFERAR